MTNMITLYRQNTLPLKFPSRENNSITDAIEATSHQTLSIGCRRGGCGLCLIKIISGQFNLKAMSRRYINQSQIEQRIYLACRIFPLSDMEVEVIT